MKTLWRTLIILFAAFLVIGATVGLANAGVLGSFSRFPGERGGFGEGNFTPGNLSPDGFQPRGGGEGFGEGFRPEHDFGGREGGFGRGLNIFTWIKNLALISVIVVVVVGLERLFTRKRRPAAVVAPAPSFPSTPARPPDEA